MDNVDSPLIVPPPGSIIRRTARTKIRKNSLLGDGGGHRFGPSRRGASRASPLNEAAGDVSIEEEEGGSADRSSSSGSRKVSSGSQLERSYVDDDASSHTITPPMQNEDRAGPPQNDTSLGPLFGLQRDAAQPIPVQYMPPKPPLSGDALADRMDAVDLGDSQPLHTVRAGADLPPTSTATTSPPKTGQMLPGSQNALPSLPSGSLRTTRKPGVPATHASGQPTSAPSITPNPASTLPPVLPTLSRSPPPSSTTHLPVGPHTALPQSTSTEIRQAESSVRTDSKPALPHKSSQERLGVRPGQPPVSMNPQQRDARPTPSPSPSSSHPPPVQPTPVPSSAEPQGVAAQLRRASDPNPKTGPPSQQPQPQQRQASYKQPSPSAPAVTPKEKEPKKSGWARLGLLKSSKEDPNHSSSDADDGASIVSSSSSSSAFSLKDMRVKKGKKEKEPSVDYTHSKTSSADLKAGHAPAQHPPSQTEKEKSAGREKEKSESSGGFFGGLFGSKRKGTDSSSDSYGGGGAGGAHHRKDSHVANAHLQLPTPPPTASGMLTPDGKYVNFYRLPIHIERAVYRLSHIKLANPRRPLYEQVLISNLMFWYLG